jgi:hypothetical protein
MAFPNDLSRITQAVGNLDGSNSGDYTDSPKEAARQLIRRTFVLKKPAADSMAADTTAYTAADAICVYRPFRVLGAKIYPQGTVTAHDTNYATINLVKGDGAAGAEVVAASQTTKITGGSGNWAAGVPEALTVSSTAANTRFAAGTVLGFSIAKAASGVAVPICTITVEVEFEGIDSFAV